MWLILLAFAYVTQQGFRGCLGFIVHHFVPTFSSHLATQIHLDTITRVDSYFTCPVFALIGTYWECLRTGADLGRRMFRPCSITSAKQTLLVHPPRVFLLFLLPARSQYFGTRFHSTQDHT